MDLSGIIVLHKPKGMTSHDCVLKLRRLLQMKKIGHTGTLDPDVHGVLPVCVGRATKVVSYMTNFSKEYEGEVTIGQSTTTEDKSGEIVSEKKVKNDITNEQIDQLMTDFEGEYVQIPPMYSAVRVKGKRLYEYARKGIEVERPKRNVTIHSLARKSNVRFNEGTANFSFRVHCSKGTYVRTLAVDIGKALGYPAHLSRLARTASGPFTLSESYTFEQIEQIIKENTIQNILLPLDKALTHLPKLIVSNDIARQIVHGAVLPKSEGLEQKRFTVYNEQDDCLAVYKHHPTKEGLIKPETMFITQNDCI